MVKGGAIKGRSHRGDLEINATILKLAQLNKKKTHIVYKGNLNFKILNKHLTQMMEWGLITETLFVTSKGERYISLSNSLIALQS